MSNRPLVPLLAVIFSLANGLGLQPSTTSAIIDRLALDQPALAGKLRDYVRHTDLRALGGVGLLTFLWFALDLYAKLESALNEIWSVPAGRGGTLGIPSKCGDFHYEEMS